MENSEIIEKIYIGIKMLFSNDYWLLINDLSEKSITHKLAEYLQILFTDYNVDCEYNGNIKSENGRKMISILKEELERKNLLKANEINNTDDEIACRLVFPDIIIHKRGTNESNLCIIEVKKSTRDIPFDYDEIKLKAYTTGKYGNDLRYKLGLFIEFMTRQPELDYRMKYYIDGESLSGRKGR